MVRRFCLQSILLLAVASASADPKTIRIPLVSDARGGAPSTWQYTTVDPGAGWADTGFSDAGWQAGTGGFGSGTPDSAHINTAWSTGQIWLRTAFTLPDVSVQSVILSLYHDEDVQIFLNGVAVFQESAYTINYGEPALTEDFKAALKPGKNVLAINCANTDGPGYIDAGLAVLADFNATTLVGDARSAAPADWNYTIADPGADWSKADFDATAWITGKGGFGSVDYATGTAWTDSDIWMQTSFQAAAKSPFYSLSFFHDDNLDVYLNGTQVLQASAWNTDYEDALSAAVAQAIVIGKNTLSVHCHNAEGPQFVDVGLSGLEKGLSTGIMAKSRGARVSGKGPVLLAAAGARVDLASVSAGTSGRLSVFGSDGRLVAAVPGGGAARYLPLPVTLGAGVFRYRWESKRGILQGTLLKLP